ncbi:hypothetical protein NC651_028053 [Populus alba x Populus x berolinensis]|nr:hypothetical protein NC651_028053 [Populus alba x Populus x berolinensis]
MAALPPISSRSSSSSLYPYYQSSPVLILSSKDYGGGLKDKVEFDESYYGLQCRWFCRRELVLETQMARPGSCASVKHVDFPLSISLHRRCQEPMVCGSLGKGLIVQGEDTSPQCTLPMLTGPGPRTFGWADPDPTYPSLFWARPDPNEEKTTGRGGHGRDQEVELTVSVASLEVTVAGADHEGRKKNSAEVRKEETVTVSGVGDGLLVVGMDSCGGADGGEAGGGVVWWLER